MQKIQTVFEEIAKSNASRKMKSTENKTHL